MNPTVRNNLNSKSSLDSAILNLMVASPSNRRHVNKITGKVDWPAIKRDPNNRGILTMIKSGALLHETPFKAEITNRIIEEHEGRLNSWRTRLTRASTPRHGMSVVRELAEYEKNLPPDLDPPGVKRTLDDVQMLKRQAERNTMGTLLKMKGVRYRKGMWATEFTRTGKTAIGIFQKGKRGFVTWRYA